MEFTLNSVFLLIRRQLIKDWRKYAIAVIVGMFAAIFISILSCINTKQLDINIYQKITTILFFIGGAIISSSIFKELEKPETGYQYMTLPASSLEKIVAAWLISFLIYGIISTIAIALGATLLYAVTWFGITIEGNIFETFPIFDFAKYLIVLNAIFLAGAAAFRNNPFIKTSLFVFVYSALIIALTGLIAFAFFKLNPSPFHHISGNNIQISNANFLTANPVFQSILFVCGIVFIWVVAYFKLKERTL